MKVKVIKTKSEYEAALARIDKLMDAEPNTPQGDELELLTLLVHDFEEKKFPMDKPDPVAAIRFRMEQQGLAPKDLVQFLGSRSRVSEVLSGRRRLSLKMIRSLVVGLRIPAELLLGEPGKAQMGSAGVPFQCGMKNGLDRTEHTSKSVHMRGIVPLQPTLWRTCRVLANRTRLRILQLIISRPETVAVVAERLRLSLSLTSEYLRALEARGLLVARRLGRHVEYRSSSATGSSAAAGLVKALRVTFKRQPEPIETIFRFVTAFTHPRRVAIFRLVKEKPGTASEIRFRAGISGWALERHIRKLETRGFVKRSGRLFAARQPHVALGRALARLAGSHED